MRQELLRLFARRNSGFRPTITLVESVGGDPAAHHHHRHTRTGMGRPSRQIETLKVRTGIGWLERSGCAGSRIDAFKSSAGQASFAREPHAEARAG